MSKSDNTFTQDHTPLPLAHQFVRLCGRALVTESLLDEVRRAGGDLSPHDWRVVMSVANDHGLAPIVYLIATSSKALEWAPQEVASALLARYTSTLISVRRIEGQLDEILHTFASSAQDILVVKGAPLSRRLYRDVALRPMGDIDLLARPGEIQRACAALASLGYHPVPGQGDPKDFLALTCWTVLYRRGEAPPVELHWRLMPLPSYQRAFDSERLWSRSRQLSHLDAIYSGLGLEDELRYLCVHYAAQHHQARLIWLVDIARFIYMLPGVWDWRSWLDTVIALGIATPVMESLRDCQAILDVELPDGAIDLLATAAASAAERRAWTLAHARFYHPGRLLTHGWALDTGAERLTLASGALRRYLDDGRDYIWRRLRLAWNRLPHP